MHRFTWIVLIFFYFGLYSQNVPDTGLIRDLESRISNAQGYFKSNLDSALILLEEIKPEVLTVDNEDLKARFRIAQAQSMLYTEKYEDIIPLLQPNIDNGENISIRLQGETYRSIGAVYRQLWIPDSALTNFISALRLFEKAGYKRGISQTYLGLGMVYSTMGNEEMASDFFDRSIFYSENSAVVEMHKKRITDQDTRPVSVDQVLQLSFDILKIAQSTNDERTMSIVYNDIKHHYYLEGDYEKALEYAALELKYRERTASKSLLSRSLWSVGDIYLKIGDPDQAIPLFERAIPQATDSLRLSIYSNLKTAYRSKGDLRRALQYSDSYVELKDSLDQKQNEKNIAEVMAQFQTEIQREQIKNLSVENELAESQISRQRIILFSIVGGAALLLFLGFLGYKNYRSVQQLKQSQLNSKLLRTQMNPHFVFNALNEIKLNIKDDNKDETENHLNSYSRLMRLVLESSTKEFVPLKDEIELISNYLELQCMIYDDSFDYTVDIDPDLELNYLMVPPMLSQPFVENSVIHGVKESADGDINVSYGLNEDVVHIVVKDNGAGFDASDGRKNKDHKSHAMTNIVERTKAYEKLHNFNIDVAVESVKGEGTSVTIIFPQKV